MADITLISGSTLGSAEYVAEHLAEKLEEAGYSTEIQHGPLVDDLQAQGIWLIILFHPWRRRHSRQPGSLLMTRCRRSWPIFSAVRFGAIGIGSREYDTFCGAIDKLEAALKACGAKQIGETLKINVLEHEIPEDPAEIWLGCLEKFALRIVKIVQFSVDNHA